MRTISEMYRLSGGTDYRNLCAECNNCIREGKSFICRLYAEAGGNRRWEPQWIACKFFNATHLPGKEAVREDVERQQEGIQMSIFDYPECIPGGKL